MYAISAKSISALSELDDPSRLRVDQVQGMLWKHIFKAFQSFSMQAMGAWELQLSQDMVVEFAQSATVSIINNCARTNHHITGQQPTQLGDVVLYTMKILNLILRMNTSHSETMLERIVSDDEHALLLIKALSLVMSTKYHYSIATQLRNEFQSCLVPLLMTSIPAAMILKSEVIADALLLSPLQLEISRAAFCYSCLTQLESAANDLKITFLVDEEGIIDIPILRTLLMTLHSNPVLMQNPAGFDTDAGEIYPAQLPVEDWVSAIIFAMRQIVECEDFIGGLPRQWIIELLRAYVSSTDVLLASVLILSLSQIHLMFSPFTSYLSWLSDALKLLSEVSKNIPESQGNALQKKIHYLLKFFEVK
jgi:hypothetical protein